MRNLIILLIFGQVLCMNAVSRKHLGVIGGLSQQLVSGKSFFGFDEHNDVTVIAADAGVFFELPISDNCWFRPEYHLTEIGGCQWYDAYVTGPGGESHLIKGINEYRSRYLELPLLLHWRSAKKDSTPTFTLGAAFDIPVKWDIGRKDYESLSYSISETEPLPIAMPIVGIGYQYTQFAVDYRLEMRFVSNWDNRFLLENRFR
jgi:hypothetical protein